ncbi:MULTISPECIES: hypothetical protein [Myxococcus]|nr:MULTISPECIES: hypothetical protein [Myxococcus]WAM28622.1 hypothetical protein OZ403_11140 [Myxococcus sp. NMCA1]
MLANEMPARIFDLSTGALLAQVQGARRNDERAEKRLNRLLVP